MQQISSVNNATIKKLAKLNQKSIVMMKVVILLKAFTYLKKQLKLAKNINIY